MLARSVITCVNRYSLVPGQLRVSFSLNASSSTSNRSNAEETERPARKLKEWRKPLDMPVSNLKMFEAPEPKKKQLIFPRQVFRLPASDMKHWWKSKRVDFNKINQKFIQKRHEILGCDLAAGHFLVYRGGRVKFFGQSEWIIKDDSGKINLPSKYDNSWQLTDVDASGVPLYYEGIENFLNLYRVTWASFRNNPNLDDWCVDAISANFPSIEHLDISGCENVSERALEALYRLENLKTLIVTNWHKLPSFELTCTMLEDCNPDLTIEILDSGKEREENKQT